MYVATSLFTSTYDRKQSEKSLLCLRLQMRLYMREIEKRYPDMAKVYTIGFTHENRPIEMIKVGVSRVPEN